MFFFFFFNDTATTEIYTLSLHDALPISLGRVVLEAIAPAAPQRPATFGTPGLSNSRAAIPETTLLPRPYDGVCVAHPRRRLPCRHSSWPFPWLHSARCSRAPVVPSRNPSATPSPATTSRFTT